jgi:hypothetical protein
MYMYFLPSIGGQHKDDIGSITDAISSVSCVNSAKPISKHQKLFPVDTLNPLRASVQALKCIDIHDDAKLKDKS